MFRKSITLAACLAGAAITLPAATSSARECGGWVIPGFTNFTCRLPANPNSHHIHVHLANWVHGELVDDQTLVTVYEGTAGFWNIEKTVRGLSGVYWMRATGPVPASFSIGND